ncbi:Ubr3 [Symbiodinium natans]|uniref:E3 ubiquitin-protein ligase n=1 Tax=Symbiodinium natans TaxID=878477 RepID=A0A812TW13_9DINO|nr:Ubr3 [Symbiodinium natans]
MLGEVTQHAQVCGFGTCIFLQLSNSLVHIVTDGLITCWGSLYLDGHGEEEYNLSRPLYISEVRLQQLTQLVREASFDFESRLKWKKVIFVPWLRGVGASLCMLCPGVRTSLTNRCCCKGVSSPTDAVEHPLVQKLMISFDPKVCR